MMIVSRGILIAPAASGGSFSPTDIAGLGLWLDAQTISNSPGDPVETWSDASGNLNHAQQSDPNKWPTLVRPVGSLNAVSFDGTQFLVGASPATTSDVFTAFVVLQIPASTSPQAMAIHNGNNNGFAFECRDGYRELLHRIAQVLTDGAPTPGDYEIWAVRRTADPLSTFYVNGSGTSITNPTASMYTPTTCYSVGAGDGGTNFFWNSVIFEAMFYDSALSDPDLARVLNYLAAKYTDLP